MAAIGITGHRQPSQNAQAAKLEWFLDHHPQYTVLHHGACVGIDAMSHYVALESNLSVVVHPPTNTRWLASDTLCYRPIFKAVWVRNPLPYKERNQAIVNDSKCLLAFPLLPEDHPDSVRSGTWQTVRMARMASLEIYIVTPKGLLTRDVPPPGKKLT